MGSLLISPSTVNGRLSVPSSKSHTLRAILFGSLAKGTTIIKQPLLSDDSHAMIDACRLLGATIDRADDQLTIQGVNGQIQAPSDVINARNSGIVFRFVSAIAALSSHYSVITGDHSIRHQRPIQPLLEGLSQLGAFAVSTKSDGYAPVIIRGPLTRHTAIIDGEDSQPVSALLIAMALKHEESHLTVRNPGEKPWVQMTLNWFERLGIPYCHENYERYTMHGNARINGFTYTVPSDLSSAAFPIAAALVTQSELTLENIDLNDHQGDKDFVPLLQKMGAHIEFEEASRKVSIKKGSKLKGIEVDLNHCIDTLPILSVLACFAEGETRISNAKVARTKECDRIHAIATELQRMGGQIVELPDGLIIQPASLKGAEVHSYHDHRMAMSLAVAALGATGKTKIHQTDCIAKTYPEFASAFKTIGAKIEVDH